MSEESKKIKKNQKRFKSLCDKIHDKGLKVTPVAKVIENNRLLKEIVPKMENILDDIEQGTEQKYWTLPGPLRIRPREKPQSSKKSKRTRDDDDDPDTKVHKVRATVVPSDSDDSEHPTYVDYRITVRINDGFLPAHRDIANAIENYVNKTKSEKSMSPDRNDIDHDVSSSDE